MVERASRAARKLADNLAEKNMLWSECINFFARLEREIDTYVEGARSVGTGGLSGIGNLPMSVTKSRREKICYIDCTEGHASKKARLGLGLRNNLPWQCARDNNDN